MPRLGTHPETGASVVLSDQARRQGTYVIGTTGAGKTTLLESIAIQDMKDPSRPGMAVLDPHGDFIERLLTLVPRDRRDDVVLFAPGDEDQFNQPLGLNILDCNRADPRQVRRVTSTVIDTLYKLFAYSWGPRMEDLLRHSILALMETPGTTLLDLLLLLASPDHRKHYTADLKDPVLRHFFGVQLAALSKRELVEVAGSSLNKIGRFLSDPLIRNIVAQPKNAFDMRRIMDEGKILLVNLSKGDLGEDNSSLLGSVLVNLVLIAALKRREIEPEKRKPFHLIVDEYQSFATATFPTLQSEARKYALDVIVAHQYRDQLDELNLGSTLNVGNFITLRVTGKDSMELAAQFDNTPPEPDKLMQPMYRPYKNPKMTGDLFEVHNMPGVGTVYQQVNAPRRTYSDVQAERANSLSTLPNFKALCRLIDSDGRLTETEVKLDRVAEKGDLQTASTIRTKSLKLGRPREEVEREIAAKIGGKLKFDPIPVEEIINI